MFTIIASLGLPQGFFTGLHSNIIKVLIATWNRFFIYNTSAAVTAPFSATVVVRGMVPFKLPITQQRNYLALILFSTRQAFRLEKQSVHSFCQIFHDKWLLLECGPYPKASKIIIICKLIVPESVIGLQNLVTRWITVPPVLRTLVFLKSHVFLDVSCVESCGKRISFESLPV